MNHGAAGDELRLVPTGNAPIECHVGYPTERIGPEGVLFVNE